MKDNGRIQRALRDAVQHAVREHKLLGYPIVVWRDGKVTWIPPEEIVLESDAVGVEASPHGPRAMATHGTALPKPTRCTVLPCFFARATTVRMSCTRLARSGRL